ncbi:hypothetical protein COOONC_28000 [Cooperia oncophora]
MHDRKNVTVTERSTTSANWSKQTTTEVHLLGTSRKALLDTGSQISIIPLHVLQAALESSFDLDADVEEIPLGQQKQVFDASGNRMSFKGAIRLTLQTSDGKKQRIAAFAMAGGDGMLVLGTNVLRPLGYDLTQRNCSEFVALPPIRDHLLPDVVWEYGEKAVEVPVTNTFAGAKIFRLGEELGILQPAKVVEVKPYSGDMLGRTVEAPTDREGRLIDKISRSSA